MSDDKAERLRAWQIKRKEGLVPLPIRLDPIGRSRSDLTSLRKAINAKCFDCCGFQNDTLAENDYQKRLALALMGGVKFKKNHPKSECTINMNYGVEDVLIIDEWDACQERMHNQ